MRWGNETIYIRSENSIRSLGYSWQTVLQIKLRVFPKPVQTTFIWEPQSQLQIAHSYLRSCHHLQELAQKHINWSCIPVDTNQCPQLFPNFLKSLESEAISDENVTLLLGCSSSLGLSVIFHAEMPLYHHFNTFVNSQMRYINSWISGTV